MYLISCNKASLYTLDNSYLCDAKVSQITESSAVLSFPEPSADILRSEMLVTFYDNSKGLTSFYCLFSDYKEYLVSPGVTHSSVLCTMERPLSSIQRRKDIKVQISMSVTLRYKKSDGTAARANGIIRDISAGGIYFTSSCAFPAKQELHFNLPSIRPDLILSAKILRAEATDEEGVFGYGCSFINLPAHAESSVRSFVYRQEMLRRTRR